MDSLLSEPPEKPTRSDEVTGVQTCALPICGMDLTDEQVDAALQRWIDFCVEYGVSAVFDAGLPGDWKFHEKG